MAEYIEQLTLEQMVVIAFVLYNIVVFFVYGIDKGLAIKEKRRIRERTLLLLALFGGSLGALCGMKIWHHKTRKASFISWMALVVVFQLGLIYWIYAGCPLGLNP